MSSKIIGIVLLSLSVLFSADTLLLRSEYEKVGDIVGVVPDIKLLLLSDNSHFYTIDGATGAVTIAQEIVDTFGVVTTHRLSCKTVDGDTTFVTIADGYDYLLQQHSGVAIEDHQGAKVLPDTLGNWAAYNNLWGDGTAVPGVDYRIAILVGDALPHSSTIMWDTPGKAADFGGSSVWNFSNFLYGARKNNREVVKGFPFLVDSLDSLSITFDYTAIIGDDQFKVALNMFFTDANGIVPMNQNRGDFFFVLDQKGKWIPRYDSVLVEDTLLFGENFTLLYDTLIQNSTFYERRRVIVKDNGRVQKDSIDLLSFFNRFALEGMLNKQQYIPNMQFGVEVTEGFGAIVIHTLEITKKMKDEVTPTTTSLYQILPTSHFLSVTHNQIQFMNSQSFSEVTLYSLQGREVLRQTLSGKNAVSLSTSGLSRGTYLVRLKGEGVVISQKVLIP